VLIQYLRNFSVDPYIQYLAYNYMDNKLVGFYLSSPSAQYSRFAELLIAKYGQPAWHGDKAFDGTRGRYYSEALIWITPHGPMTLQRHDGEYKDMILSMMDADAEKEFSRRSQENSKEKAKKAF